MTMQLFTDNHKWFHVISGIYLSGLEENNMKKFEVSPDGRFLVFLGKYGAMHILSAKVSIVICKVLNFHAICWKRAWV